mgnify:CR=1 FL=1
MSDFLRQVDEDLQKEKLKSIWNKFKFLIISIIISLILFVIGFQYIAYEKRNQKLLTVENYFQAISQENLDNKIKELSSIESNDKVINSFINLKLSDMYFEKNNTDLALLSLEKVYKSDAQPIYKNLALYKSLMYQFDKISSDEIDNLILLYSENEDIFEFLFIELKAIKKLQEGKVKSSKNDLNLLISNNLTPNDIKVRAQKYLNIIN